MGNQDPRMDGEDTPETYLNRRPLPSKAAIDATGFVDVAGTAGAVETSAIPEKGKMTNRFRDDADVKSVRRYRRGPPCYALGRGLIGVADTSKLSEAVDQPGLIVGVVEDLGRLVTHLWTEFDVADGTVTAVVHAETERSYAFYEPHDTDEVVLIDADAQESVGRENYYNSGAKCDLAGRDKEGYDYRMETVYVEVCCATGCEWRATDDYCTRE